MELLLAVIGISQQRWGLIRQSLGIIKPCKCGERADALNKAGGWCAQRWALVKALLTSREQ